jgi:hypothetical protein
MSRKVWETILSAMLATIPVGASAQQPPELASTAIVIQADKDDSAATMLAGAIREELRRSVAYKLVDRAAGANIVVHLVGLVIPNCRPASAIAVSFVSVPAEKHLGTAVLTTDRFRVSSSARDILARIPEMIGRR